MDEKKRIDILVGNNIKHERIKAGYTQERFSELIGIGPKSLSAIERGVVGVSLPTLLRICKVLSISSDALLFEHPHRSANNTELVQRLERLSPSQYQIASEMLCNLLAAFALNE